MTKRQKKYTILFSLISFILIIMYLIIWMYTQRDLISMGHNSNALNIYLKIISRRSIQLLAIFISTILIVSSSLIFQTLTNNRILTPNVLGFDAIFTVTQTLIVSILGLTSFYISNKYMNFSISTIVMIVITLAMFLSVLRKNANNVVLLLLMGMIVSSLAGSISNFIQVFMNPEEFQSVQGLTTVSLTNINQGLVFVALPIMIILVILMFRKNRVYDVMALGEDHAIGLGIEYRKETKLSLIYIAVAVSVSTSLIGPLTFLGLIAVNSAREIFQTTKHKYLLIFSSLMGFSILMLGQIIVELMNFKTSVSVLINLIGGSYMIYLILKENKI